MTFSETIVSPLRCLNVTFPAEPEILLIIPVSLPIIKNPLQPTAPLLPKGILSPRGEEEVTFERSREACRLIVNNEVNKLSETYKS